MKKLLVVSALAAMATGCICVNKNDGGESNLRPCIVKDRVHEKYTVQDKTVSASEEVQCLFGFICWGATASHVADQAEFSGFGAKAKVKNGAYAKACEAAGCDQIAGARYTITTDDYFVYQKVKAEITGYPVKLVGVDILPPCPKAPCEQPPKPKCPFN